MWGIPITLLKKLNGKIKFGTCAWTYDDWRGVFYPMDLPKNEWLTFYSRYFSAVEIDSTFYSAPSATAVGHWLDATPDDFSFTCKMPRAITHLHKLRNCGGLVTKFLESLAPLRTKLGPILIQLPPSFRLRKDEHALKDFLFDLPRDFSFAIEFRHSDWHLPRIVKLLEEKKICWAWSDTSPLAEQNRAPFEFLPQTADCLYIRLLGDLKNKYRSNGSRAHRYGKLQWPRQSALESWAIKVEKHLADTNCAYVFSGNHYEGYSALTAQRIAEQFKQQIELPNSDDGIKGSKENEQLDLL